MTFVIRPTCPHCSMNMIISKGYKSNPEHRTFECLRCGHVKAPQATSTPARAA
jgi:uncharacterized Zn finger protein